VRHWFCDEKHCSRGSFTDSVAAVPARSRLTNRLGSEAGQRVVDGTCATVVAAGRQLGLSWPTVMEAVREQAEVSLPPELEPVGVLGIDEVRRGRPKWRPKGDGQPADGIPMDACDGGEPAAIQAVSGQQPLTETASARVLADRWQVGFTEISRTARHHRGRPLPRRRPSEAGTVAAAISSGKSVTCCTVTGKIYHRRYSPNCGAPASISATLESRC
jgi:hypothetical protein